ncbi:hypothetical protein EYF80_062697 [Liparis tanakae]|uniref:Transmembrane protein n=1 Tax=Liparis tanakae TaxID=230148 RepID=A0A4Z2EF31_9TELE|nr:hypothetical protein EYF80_062697 [Liparis tanakae]
MRPPARFRGLDHRQLGPQRGRILLLLLLFLFLFFKHRLFLLRLLHLPVALFLLSLTLARWRQKSSQEGFRREGAVGAVHGERAALRVQLLAARPRLLIALGINAGGTPVGALGITLSYLEFCCSLCLRHGELVVELLLSSSSSSSCCSSSSPCERLFVRFCCRRPSSVRSFCSWFCRVIIRAH